MISKYLPPTRNCPVPLNLLPSPSRLQILLTPVSISVRPARIKVVPLGILWQIRRGAAIDHCPPPPPARPPVLWPYTPVISTSPRITSGSSPTPDLKGSHECDFKFSFVFGVLQAGRACRCIHLQRLKDDPITPLFTRCKISHISIYVNV